MQPDPRIKALRARFRFDELLGRSRRRDHFFVLGYRMSGGEIGDARLVGSRAGPFRGRGRFRNAVWQPQPRGFVTVRDPIIIDSLELPSFASAEAELLRLLGGFHVPVRLEPITDGPGDLAFASPDQSFVAVLRGNALLRLTQARPTQSLLGVAQDLDRSLVTRPEHAEDVPDLVAVEPVAHAETLARKLAPAEVSVADIGPQFVVSAVGARRALRPEAGDDAQGEPPMVRFFSRGGWIEDQDELRFILDGRAGDGDAVMEVFEENGRGPPRRCEGRFRRGRWHQDHDHDHEGEAT